MTNEVPKPLEATQKLLFIIDNEVATILNATEKLAAIFMSNPTIVQYTPEMGEPVNGAKWNPETQTISPVVSE